MKGISDESGWVKVDKDAFRRGLDIISQAAKDHPNDRKAYREAIKRANAEIGIGSRVKSLDAKEPTGPKPEPRDG